jgi:hypothetical protein
MDSMSSVSTRLVSAILLGVLGAVLLSSCATAGSKPKWVEHPDNFYPRSKFLVGVGQGDSYEAAKAKAVADVSSEIASVVFQAIKSKSSMVDDNGDVKFKSETDVETALKTSGAFEGIETRERWCCKSGDHFVLVVMDRAASKAGLEDRLKGYESEIRHRLAGRDSVETPLEEAVMLHDTLNSAGQRDLLLAQYRVVSRGIWKDQPKTSKLESDCRSAIDRSTFRVEAKIFEEGIDKTSSNRLLASGLKDKFSNIKFKVGRGTMKLACMIILTEPLAKGKPVWIEYTWDSICEIAADREDARAIVFIEETGTVTSKSARRARSKAVGRANKAMLDQIDHEMRRYLDLPEGDNLKNYCQHGGEA